MLPLIQPELGLTNTQIGQLGFINTGFYAVSAIVFGIIQDKRGKRKTWLVMWMFLTVVATMCTAFVSTYEQLLVVRCFVGIVEGPLLGLFGAVLMNANPKNFGRNFGMGNSGVGIFAVIAGPIAVTQIVKYFTWQRTYLLVAIPTLIIAILMIIFIKEPDFDPAEIKAEKLKVKEAGGIWSLFKYRNVWACIIYSIFMFGGYWTMMLYSSVYLTSEGGMSLQTMGFATSAMGIFYVINNTLVPKLSDNLGRKPILTFAPIAFLLAPLSMALFPGNPISIVLFVLFGGGCSSCVPLMGGVVPMETVPECLKTSANGIITGIGEFVGGALFPILLGVIADASSLKATMATGAGAMFLMIVTGFMFIESNKFVIEKRAAKKAALNA
jgi:predicted MFS family arabinose efflux permease